MSAPSKYELVWAATYALEFKTLREQTFTTPDAENARWAMMRADRAIAAMIDAEKASEPEQEKTA
jgi:hypothetical protein